MDYVQEAMVRFLAKYCGVPLPSESGCGAWLVTTLKNLLLSERRKQGVRQRALSDPAACFLAAPREAEAMDAVLEALSGEAFQGAILLLSPKLRATYMLHALGATYSDIARRLGITPGTAGKRLHDARRKLRVLLEAQLAQRERWPRSARARLRPARTQRGMRPALDWGRPPLPGQRPSR